MKLTGPAGLVAVGLVAAVTVGGLYLAVGGPVPHAINTGPFGSGNSSVVAVCTPTGRTNSLDTEGDLVIIENKGPSAVIDKVSLSNPRRLVLLEAFAVPISGQAFGSNLGFPSRSDVSPGVRWAQRQRANGARIPHWSGLSNVMDLVLVLKRLGKTGSARGFDVYYHSNGQNYHYFKDTRIVLVGATKCPRRY